MKNKAILVVNAGSSNLKFALYHAGQNLEHIHNSHIESPQQQALEQLLQWLQTQNVELVAAGHRIVHGGEKYCPTLLTPNILAELEQLIPLAPLHQPYNLAGIQLLMQLYPTLPQIACFDTGFHTTQSDIATAFALPPHLGPLPIKRYGFHGLSYEYISHKFPMLTQASCDKLIIAHLGHGASLCAVKNGKSVATTMGFTALEGLVMGTRCGNIDPGVLFYLHDRLKMDMTTIKDLLYNKSGLLGLSQLSDDMRILLNSDNAAAQFAINVFVYRVQREIGSLMMALDGFDHLIFTAGIGEHAAPIREKITSGLEWLNLKLEASANIKNDLCINTKDSRIGIWVIPTNEELMIAQHTYKAITNA